MKCFSHIILNFLLSCQFFPLEATTKMEADYILETDIFREFKVTVFYLCVCEILISKCPQNAQILKKLLKILHSYITHE